MGDIDDRLRRVLEGEPLRTAAGLEPRHTNALRSQTEALFASGRWERCIAALEILSAVGDVGPYDALMRARCHQRLGQVVEARHWSETAQAILTELDARVGEAAKGNTP